MPPTVPRIRGYIAASLDGFIATPDGGIGWLDRYQDVDYGYEAFLAEIGTVVLGRATYDQALGFGTGWPYPGRRGLVVTSRPLPSPPEGVTAWRDGVAALIDHLRRASDRDVWVVGGARLQRAFLDAGALDRLDLFVIPELLGDGVPLFPRSDRRHRLQLEDARPLPRGMVRLSYAVTPA